MSLTGNWNKTIRKLRNFQIELEQKLYQTTAAAAEYVESVAVGHLRNQDLPWQPLKESYSRRKKSAKGKGSRRLSEKILIATGTYFQSISTYVDGLNAFVGIKRGVAREADGTDVVNIARVHEKGYEAGGIPKRPLWEPTFQETKPKIIQMYRKALQELLRR